MLRQQQQFFPAMHQNKTNGQAEIKLKQRDPRVLYPYVIN